MLIYRMICIRVTISLVVIMFELTGALDELERQFLKVQPSEEEAELLRRYRSSSDENRRMVFQLLGR